MTAFIAVALTSFLAAPVPKSDPAQDALQGEWKFVSFAKGTDEDPPEELAKAKLVVSGTKMTINLRSKEDTLTYTLDPKANPATIDLMVKEGDKAMTVKGMYKLEKDRLTICFGLDASERPKDFSPEKNVGTMVLEKVKKK